MGIFVIIVGVAVGWFAREATGDHKVTANETPTKAAVTPAVGADVNPAPSGVPGKRAIRKVSPKKPDGGVVRMMQPGSEEMKRMQGKMIQAMANRQRAKFQQRIDKLAEALALTDAQKADLKSWLDERVAKLESMDLNEMVKMGGDDGSMKPLSAKALEEQLAGSLTEEQKTALSSYKEREIETKADSMALKGLSQMQGVIDFEEGQRDEVYKILSEAATARVQKENGDSDASPMSVNGVGIDMDPYDLGVQDAMKEAFSDAGNSGQSPDHEKMVENFRALIDQRIEAKVDQLRPVLNDKQLDQYRTELKNKGSGMFGGGLMDVGAGEVEAGVIMIPAD